MFYYIDIIFLLSLHRKLYNTFIKTLCLTCKNKQNNKYGKGKKGKIGMFAITKAN